MSRLRIALALTASALVLPAGAHAASATYHEPALTVSKTTMNRALHCTAGLDHAKRTPLMLVTGTGASGAEAYAIGKPALDHYGAPVCYVDFPNFTEADIQVSVQYLVNGLRVMAKRAGRPVAVFGISQGGQLPRVALTYWPSLRKQVSDVIAAAGTQHGSNLGDRAACVTAPGCTPASWQQGAQSNFLKALNAEPDESPGPTSWTTVRSAGDETVQPQTGPHPTSALKGATNVLIQDICPGRQVTHIGTALDSVTFALIDDALTHAGPARRSRLPADVCAQPYAPGLDPAATANILGAAGNLTGGRSTSQPRVTAEPKVRAWMTKRVPS
jgi:triacylglycerol lipase